LFLVKKRRKHAAAWIIPDFAGKHPMICNPNFELS